MTTTEDTTIADETIANIGSTDLIDDDLKAIVTFIIRETDGFYMDLKLAPLGGIMAFLAGRERSKSVPVFGISRAATGQFTLTTIWEDAPVRMESLVCVDRDAMFTVMKAILFDGACKAAGVANPGECERPN
jgi:hypothetical protein